MSLLPEMKSAFNLKWNPFDSDFPTQGIHICPKTELFLDFMGNYVYKGGFAMITGQPGTGKSTVCRLLLSRIKDLNDVSVVALSRPQSTLGDFYRELGNKFSFETSVSNRYGSFKKLRETWLKTAQERMIKPVIIIDEAQALKKVIIEELLTLSSHSFDSKRLVTIVLSGDERLKISLDSQDFLPLKSRLAYTLHLAPKDQYAIHELLKDLTSKAGNPDLIDSEVYQTLANTCLGNARTLMHTLNQLLLTAHELKHTSISTATILANEKRFKNA
jgi:type II secretory pathway predicted ATPase ExeA